MSNAAGNEASIQNGTALQELTHSRSELQAIYDNAPIMICVLNERRELAYANRAFEDFVGEPLSVLKGNRACGVLGCLGALDNPNGCGFGPQCESCNVRTALLDTLASGRSHRAIDYHTTVKIRGAIRNVFFLVSIAAIELGKARNLLVCFEDITERKQLERIQKARLLLSEQAYKLPMDELIQMILDEAERLSESKIGFFHFVEPDQKTVLLQTWSTNTLKTQCAAEGKGRHYNVGEAGVWVDCLRERRPIVHNDYENLPHRKGLPPGHAPVIRELVAPVIRNDLVVAIFGVGNKREPYNDQDIAALTSWADHAWDVLERKKTEDALHASEARNKTILEASPFGIVLVRNGKYIYANPATLQLLGYSTMENFIGLPLENSIAKPDLDRIRQRMQQASSGHANPPIELRLIKADGTTVMTESISLPIQLKEGPAILIVGQDITRRRTMEDLLRKEMTYAQELAETNAQLLEQSKAQGQLLRRIASHSSDIEENERKRLAADLHDRVGPAITALGLILSELQNSSKNKGDDSHSSRIEDCRKLLEEIIDVTRTVISDLRPPLLDEYGLGDALDWLCDRFSKGNHFKIITGFKHASKRLDPVKELALFRIAQEALNNVVKHAAAKQVSVGFHIQKNYAILVIEDDGIGFDPAAVRSQAQKGGLGLPSMRERAAGIGAELHIDASPGKGTRITVMLPCEPMP